MNKRICSIIIVWVMIISALPINSYAGETTVVAPYGTPVIDGRAEELWNRANYYTVENCVLGNYDMYKGWFKVLWDENNIYV